MIWYKLNWLLKTSSYFYILHVFKEPSTLLHLIGQVNPGWSYPGCQRLFFFFPNSWQFAENAGTSQPSLDAFPHYKNGCHFLTQTVSYPIPSETMRRNHCIILKPFIKLFCFMVLRGKARLFTSQLFFCKIVRIERLPVQAAIFSWFHMYRGGGRSRPLRRFNTHGIQDGKP